MGDGWLMNPEDRWTYRFHRDDKAWVREPRVFVDMGRPMPDGSPALLKTRQHLRREQAEGMWKDVEGSGESGVEAGPSCMGCRCRTLSKTRTIHFGSPTPHLCPSGGR